MPRVPEGPTFIYENFCAARAIAGYRPVQFARAVGISDRGMTYIARNQRGVSQEILAKVRQLLGEEGFAFATGQRESLPAHSTKQPGGQA